MWIYCWVRTQWRALLTRAHRAFPASRTPLRAGCLWNTALPSPFRLPFILGTAPWLPTSLPCDSHALCTLYLPTPPPPALPGHQVEWPPTWLGCLSIPCPLTEARPGDSSRRSPPLSPTCLAKVPSGGNGTQNTPRARVPSHQAAGCGYGQVYSTELSAPKPHLRIYCKNWTQDIYKYIA